MVHHIKELLKTHDCVIIPGLGGLIGHYEPARRNLASGTMAPPMKRIAFNKVLNQNDGVLMHRLVTAEGISWEEARARIDGFRTEVEFALETQGAYLFPGIGRLLRESGNNLRFVPILKENLLLETFGLPLVVAQPVERLREAFEAGKAAGPQPKPVVAEAAAVPATTGKAAPSWVFRAAAAVGLAFMLTTASLNLSNTGLDTSELSLFPAATEVSARTAVESRSVLDHKLLAGFTVYTPVYVAEAESVAPVAEPFYVIVGSFLDQARLNREIAAMEARGFRIETTPGPNGYIRLALVFDAVQENPAATLRAIRDTVNADAWMIGI